MALITKKIKGTEDVLPKQSYRWQFIEGIMREEARAYGFKEIRSVRQPTLFRRRCTPSTQRAARA